MINLSDLQTTSANPAGPAFTFAQLVAKREPAIAGVLPDHIKLTSAIDQAIEAVAADHRLQACDPESVYSAFLDACRLGLHVGLMGHGFLTPGPGGVCDFVPGWQGLVDLVSRTGRASAWTGAVFEGDEFDYQLGSSPYLKHRQGDQHGNPAYLSHAYAIGRLADSDYPIIEVWTASRITAQRDLYNTQGNSHYSYTAVEAYARKLPLLQVLKYLPKSVEIARALAIDAAYERGSKAPRSTPPVSDSPAPLGTASASQTTPSAAPATADELTFSME